MTREEEKDGVKSILYALVDYLRSTGNPEDACLASSLLTCIGAYLLNDSVSLMDVTSKFSRQQLRKANYQSN